MLEITDAIGRVIIVGIFCFGLFIATCHSNGFVSRRVARLGLSSSRPLIKIHNSPFPSFLVKDPP